MSVTKELYDWLLIDVDGPSVSTSYDSTEDVVKIHVDDGYYVVKVTDFVTDDD